MLLLMVSVGSARHVHSYLRGSAAVECLIIKTQTSESDTDVRTMLQRKAFEHLDPGECRAQSARARASWGAHTIRSSVLQDCRSAGVSLCLRELASQLASCVEPPCIVSAIASGYVTDIQHSTYLCSDRAISNYV